jgi:hypothetical protein
MKLLGTIVYQTNSISVHQYKTLEPLTSQKKLHSPAENGSRSSCTAVWNVALRVGLSFLKMVLLEPSRGTFAKQVLP